MKIRDILSTLKMIINPKYIPNCDNVIDNEIIPYIAKHRLEGLFYHRFRCTRLVPKYIVRDSRIKSEYYSLRAILLENAAKDLYNKFLLNHVQVLFSKGIVLNRLLYKQGERYYGDIDIFIRKEDLYSTKKILLEDGFIQGDFSCGKIIPAKSDKIEYYEKNTHQTVPFFKLYKSTEIPICVDINYKLNSDCDEKSISAKFYNDIFENKNVLKLGDTQLPCFDNELLLIHVCYNIYRDAMSVVRIRNKQDITLYQYADLHRLLSMNLEYTKLLYYITTYKFEDAVYYALYNLQTLLHTHTNCGNLIYILKLISPSNPDIVWLYGSVLDGEKGVWEKDFNERVVESIYE